MKRNNILKNSEYYYKKAEKMSLKPLFLSGFVALVTSLGIVFGAAATQSKNKAELRNETGYTATIQQELDYLDIQYKNGDISYDLYDETRTKILNADFENYLISNNDNENLTKLKEIDDKALGQIIFALTTVPIIIGGTGAGQAILNKHYKKKAKKIEQEENQSFIEIDF